MFAFNEHQPEGHVNLGFAHGVAGILAFLAAAAEAGVPAAREPLEQGVRWFVAQRLHVKRLFDDRDDADVPTDAGYGLLFGAAGVGLALASAVSDRAPAWDAAMFVSPTSRVVANP